MKRSWFAHGRWPLAYLWSHWLALALFAVLLVTGLLLFLPGVHTTLIPVLPILYAVHIASGIALASALLLPLLKRLPRGRKVRRLEWILAQALIAALTVSGAALWQIGLFPATWRATAFTWHGNLAYVMAGMIIVHALMRIFSVDLGGSSERFDWRVNYERRDFLKWSATGAVGMFIGLFLGQADGSAPFVSGQVLATSGGRRQGKSSVPTFPEYYTVTGSYPALSPADYRLTVDGLVDSPLRLSLDELEKLGGQTVIRNFQCVTGWVVPNVAWTGITLRRLAAIAKVRPEARYVTFYSGDGVYTDSLSVEQAARPDIMLAYRIDGQPLPREQGYPVRLIVPDMYGYKSVKWVRRVSFATVRDIGYWERNGYPANAFIGGSSGGL